MNSDITQINRIAKRIVDNTGLDTVKGVNDLHRVAISCKPLLDDKDAVELMLDLNSQVEDAVLRYHRSNTDLVRVYWESMRDDARYRFDKFMLCMERNRPAKEQFYLPRMDGLREVVQGIQDLADDKLDELFINLPPRTGKTQMVKFAVVWWASRNPELSNLYSAYSDKITKAFYIGLLELITDPTYCYREIFPECQIVRQAGDDEIIDLNRAKTYPSITCRSIYGTLNGSCDCTGLGVSDDLLSGIEEAINPDRLDTVWGKFDNNFVPRFKFDYGAKMINMGTRWAILDPQGRRQDLLETAPQYADWRYRIISIPALNDQDESNFDYPYGVGFSTDTYRRRRASFEANNDMPSWDAQYMQNPVDRQGVVFTPETMQFYNGELPREKDGTITEPDRVYMAVDEAFGGGDFVAAPICYQYGNMHFIHDVVYNNGDKYVTRALIAKAILDHKVNAVQFEETASTADYHEWVESNLRDHGYFCNITVKAPSRRVAKQMRILNKAPEIRDFFFRDNTCRTSEYQQFMNNLYSFKFEGKMKHDDAPDAMAQLCELKINFTQTAELLDSPF